ncbi:hypothetical protein BFW01_g1759 [Lasiodiplodia theobromae]|nr:hypothetical protein BFW01_g1759 [Lasiodiplodia theobromae]
MARGIRAGETRSAAQIEYDTTESIFAYFAERGLVSRLHRTLGSGTVVQAPGMIAGMVLELRGKVTSKINLFKVLL